MRQPVSRISFDRRRGFLGVHLQEGALFVDAAWNEGADIAFSQLRDAVIAGGIAGSAGRELLIAPQLDAGRLRNLIVSATSPDDALAPRPFYCGGLPVLWLADLPIDAQPIGDAFRAEVTEIGAAQLAAGTTWIDLLQDIAYEVYLRAHVATLDRLDDPFLDDPGLTTARGTFRKRVISEVRIRKADVPHQAAGSNVRLSVDGSYLSELNALYRVELDADTSRPGAPAAAVLWDPDAAATVARVVDSAARGARLIMVDSTDGFDAGVVRFEGPGVGPELYRVAKAPGLEGAAIQITRHRCDRAEVSLAAWQPIGAREDLDPDHFAATLAVPAPVQAGDILRSLPSALELNAATISEVKVITVAAFDADHEVVTLTVKPTARDEASPRALAIADWTALRPADLNTDGSYTLQLQAPPAVDKGDIVTALPPTLGTPSTGPWLVLSVVKAAAPVAATTDAKAAPAPVAPPPRPLRKITFGPAGLAQPLATLDLARKATLRAPVRPFDTTLTVDERFDWAVGMRVSILRKAVEGAAVSTTSVAAREDRTIVRIVHFPGGLVPGERRRPGDPTMPTMLVRLDQPLAYDHVAGDEEVVPERLIRVRRFAGHACRLPIDRIDPVRDGVASIANFASGLALPDGLSLHLTIERNEPKPRIARGDGWHFAARGDGFVETRLFAPVEEPPASEVPLARLRVNAHGYELVDLRPVPAALSPADELARIAVAAASLAGLLGYDPAAQLAREIAALAGYPRVQPDLMPRLRELAAAHRSRLYSSGPCRPWLERFARTVAAVPAGAEPTRPQLAAIAFALGGMTFALSVEHTAPHAAPPTPSPSPLPSSPTPAAPTATTTTPPATAPMPTIATPTSPANSSAPPTPRPASTTAPFPVVAVRPAPATSPPPVATTASGTTPPPTGPAAAPAKPAGTSPPPIAGATKIAAKLEPARPDARPSLLERADALLGSLEQELKAAASIAVTGIAVATEVGKAARGEARPADAKPGAPTPPAVKPDPKPAPGKKP
jgi:hypothetical protein